MGELLTMAGIITAIILCFVGIVKLPFSKFKAKKPKLYKATFTILSLLLSVGACIVSHFYIFKDNNITNYIILQLGVIAGVFGLYSSYEGLGLKNLVNMLLEKLKEYFSKAPESKLTKYVDKVGLDKAMEIIESMKQIAETAKQSVNVEPTTEAQTQPTTVVPVETQPATTVVEVKDIRDDRPLI